MDLNKLQEFVQRAGAATYISGGKEEENPPRPGFKELVYIDGDWNYRDSYIGFTRSRGMEVVRYKGTPVWSTSYGGGMIKDKENLAKQTFDFLKKAMQAKDPNIFSARGQSDFREDKYEYKYSQDGNIEEFNGYEEIYYQGELVFFHRIIGGVINY